MAPYKKNVQDLIEESRDSLWLARGILKEKGASIAGTAAGELVLAVEALANAVEILATHILPSEINDPTQEQSPKE